jgi:phosphate transport system permease protein
MSDIIVGPDMDTSTGRSPAARRINFKSAADQAHLRARYRTEAWFKYAGLLAIGIAALFLATLVFNIVSVGLPAFWQHSLAANIQVNAADIDPAGTKDPIAIRGADYAKIAKTALRGLFPEVEERADKKLLDALLSSGAADSLRNRLVADPALIGTSVATSLLLSADADLYLKGDGTSLTAVTASGAATPSGTSGEITITVPDATFAKDLAWLNGSTPDAVMDDKRPSLMVALNGGIAKISKLQTNSASAVVIKPLTSVTAAKPGDWQYLTIASPESERRLTDQQILWLERLKSQGNVQTHVNWLFFTGGDSREPELAGIRGSLIGTLLTLFVALSLCVPIGVLAAVYLEEFAPKNRWTDLIEININNLAAVPSIVFGLLGLAVFLNAFGLPRSAPLVGGIVLSLLVVPTIIIASRAALKSVPGSIKDAALGVGASQQQAVFHHVLPLAMPGIMTGTIIGMAHALGETAPLLMIGMVAFVVDVPRTLTDAATVLPVQVYLWADLPERAFVAKTAAASIVLLVVLFLMNGVAIALRRRFERRW